MLINDVYRRLCRKFGKAPENPARIHLESNALSQRLWLGSLTLLLFPKVWTLKQHTRHCLAAPQTRLGRAFDFINFRLTKFAAIRSGWSSVEMLAGAADHLKRSETSGLQVVKLFWLSRNSFFILTQVRLLCNVLHGVKKPFKNRPNLKGAIVNGPNV